MGIFRNLFDKKRFKSGNPDVKFVDDDYQAQTVSTSLRESDRHSEFTFKFIHLVIPGIKLVHIDRKLNGDLYEVYFAPDYRTGVDFLRKIPRNEIPTQYYVIVEIPDGNIGKDIDGMFNESTGEAIE